MITLNIIGAKRELLKNIFKGSPVSERGSLKKAYGSLKKEGYIKQRGRKKGEPYVSLEPVLVPEIVQILEYNRCNKCGEFLANLTHCKHCNKKP